MKTAKEIKEELEKEHGWNFSSEENMEMYYELFLDVQKVALRQPPVVGRSEQFYCKKGTCKEDDQCNHCWNIENPPEVIKQ